MCAQGNVGHEAAITAHMFLGPGLMKELTTYCTFFETYQQVNIAAFRAQNCPLKGRPVENLGKARIVASLVTWFFEATVPPDGCYGATGWMTLRQERYLVAFENADRTCKEMLGDCHKCLHL